jgi:hypothetical protein
MLKDFNSMEQKKLWAIHLVVKTALEKTKKNCVNDKENQQLILLEILEDMTFKIMNTTWTDDYGLHHGYKSYQQLIDDL